MGQGEISPAIWGGEARSCPMLGSPQDPATKESASNETIEMDVLAIHLWLEAIVAYIYALMTQQWQLM